MNRRTAITTGLTASTSLLSGCGAFDYPAHRSISAGPTNVERSESEWVVEIEVSASATGYVDPGEEAFHDVVVLVYSKEWTLICSKRMGDLTDIGGAENFQVTITCSEFPYHLTLDAEESPCDPDTVIRIATYAGNFEDGRLWQADRRRKCGEGLPPGPES